MAIKVVNSRYPGFIFDGENSRDYGIYVQNVKVFGAPTRDVEMISIPGRDGEFALDKGRFNNIQVVYTCAFGTDTQTDFNTGVSDFRNWLASRKGYKRLEDEINTTEYRMAVFKDGLDVSTLNKETGTFEVTFDCKPQRFLKSGETAVPVTHVVGAITNPTLFESHPILQVWGYGGFGINGEMLQINSAPIGRVTIDGAYNSGVRFGDNTTKALNLIKLNNGDKFAVGSNRISCYLTGEGIESASDITVTSAIPNALWGATQYSKSDIMGEDAIFIEFNGSPANTFEFAKNRNGLYSDTFTVEATGMTSFTIEVEIQCDAVGTLTASVQPLDSEHYCDGIMLTYSDVIGTSSKSALGEPLYFDLDIGEAYKIEDGQIISVNNAVTIPAKLPVLVPGSNGITYDNTITQFKIVPRWWKV